MRTKKHTRFSRKLDALMWALLALMPVFAYFVTFFHNASTVPFLDYIQGWSFPFVEAVMVDVLDAVGFNSIPIVPLLSYMVGVEIVHLFYDFLVFIPRLTHKLMERIYNND